MKLSVGIITYNEENKIGKTLDSVKEKHSQMNYIFLKDSFFLKRKQWEY